MVWEREKAFDNVWTSVLMFAKAFIEIDFPEERMLLFFGALVSNNFHHNIWTDIIDKRRTSSANTVILLEGVRIGSYPGESGSA